MVDPVVSDWEDKGRLAEVVLPCRGVTMPLGSCAPGMICKKKKDIEEEGETEKVKKEKMRPKR